MRGKRAAPDNRFDDFSATRGKRAAPENDANENLTNNLVEIVPETRFFIKRAAPDSRFDDFSATRG